MSSTSSAAERIPDATLHTLAKSFFVKGRTYGFRFADYVRFVNVLLDVAMEAERNPAPAPHVSGLPLHGAQVTLRVMAPSDRPVIARWVADPKGRWFLLSRATGHCTTLDQLLDDPANTFGVVEYEGRPVGVVAFLQREGHKAELRKLIGDPRVRGRGLAREATQLWISYGRKVLDFRKIYLYTLASNERNVRLNQQVGFRVEGLLRTEVHVDGEDHDVLRMALVTPGQADRR